MATFGMTAQPAVGVRMQAFPMSMAAACGTAAPTMQAATAPGKRQLPTVQLAGGIPPGVQYMPAIVPMEQWAQMQNSGAVPIGQMSAAQLSNGGYGGMGLNLLSLAGVRQFPGQMAGVAPMASGGMAPMAMMGQMTQMNGSMAQQPSSGFSGGGSRPARGRSPRANHRSSPEAKTSGGGGGAQSESWRNFSQADQPSLSKNNSKEPWRPTFDKDPEKRQSMERRHSVERRQSAERRHSAERRQSAERRHSAERRFDGPGGMRRSKSFGPTADRMQFNQGVQMSERWQQPLSMGNTANVYLIADSTQLAQAAHRLSYLGQETVSAVNCEGVNLKTAAGRLCLIEVVFKDGAGLQCYLFDVIQLGEQVNALSPFFTNPQASKIMIDATTNATVFAHKFGINLAGAIDAQWAYEALNRKAMLSPIEVLDWINVSTPQLKDDYYRFERFPEYWGHRPFDRGALQFAVQSICMLHAGSSSLWKRLSMAYGQATYQMVVQTSQHRVDMAAAAGWACRQAGVWTEQTNNPYFAKQDKDEELDDWLARRFQRPGPAEPVKPAGTALRASSQEPVLPPNALREGDSPRTAAWRARMAQINPMPLRSSSKSRQRSRSPSLERWLARRGNAKGGEEDLQLTRPSRRASSVPSSRDAQIKLPDLPDFSMSLKVPTAFTTNEVDGRAWAEIVEEEQALEARLVDEELFEDLKQEERKRISQAELSSKLR